MPTVRAPTLLAALLLLAPRARAVGVVRAPAEAAPVSAGDSTVTGRVVPSEVLRDVGALAPEFRTRLDRVLERMRAEFGYEVEIVETLRSR